MNGQSDNNSVERHPILSVLRPGQTFTSEQYEANKRKVAQLKRLTENLERRNEEAYDRHVAQGLEEMLRDEGSEQLR